MLSIPTWFLTLSAADLHWPELSIPGVEKQEVATSAMDIYWSVLQGWVKTSGNVIWLQTLEGTYT